MLNRVIGLLADEGWFDPSQRFDKTVYLTHGAAQTLLLSRDGEPECFVKFSERSSLQLEAQRCEAAARRFPGLAPAFIGHARRGPLEVLATRAVVFRALNAGLMRSSRHMGVVQSGLEGYFRRMSEFARAPGGPRDWVADYRAYFENLPWRQAAGESLDDLLEVVATLPRPDQHGDFVVNNLGIGRQGRLAVFDWEDYGAVDVPGLDLFTLEVSLHEASAPGGDGRVPSGRVHGLDIERLCGAMSLPVDTYDRLRLAYAFVFRFLKRNYGPEVRGRVDRLLHRLSAVAAAAA